jgi:glycosyltransferase involved in cell wall biosynthesis
MPDTSTRGTAASSRPLHVAMVAPPYFSIPPEGYGGVESVVAGLVDGLVDRGHRVTLLATGEHATRAQRFIRTWDEPPTNQLGEALPEVVNAARVADLIGAGTDYDVVHEHTLAGPLLARGRRAPTLVTVHGPMNELADVYRPLGADVSLVAISENQRSSAADLNWVGTVHNAIDVSSFPFRDRKDDYVLFLGRFHETKGPHLAIDAARAAGVRILLAGKCAEPPEQEFFEAEIAPRLGPDAVYVGDADSTEKRKLLAGARCLVFPIMWDEPFGMVMVEAMACGTPVVAFPNGSVPEVVVDGSTGIIVEREADLAAAIDRASALDPADCRRDVEERFSIEAMAAGYEDAYRAVARPPASRIEPALVTKQPGVPTLRS